MAFELRITDAGRAALADGTNLGTNAIRLTKMAIGSGQGPGGEADDGRTALRTQKMVVALGGSTMVSGRIAVKGDFQPTEAFDVTELGLLGRVGNGAEELYAYWTHASDVLASTIAGTRLVIAGSLDIQPAAAEVMVTIDATISLGDPALSASVTAVSGRVDSLETADTEAAAARAALGARVDTIENADFGAGLMAAAVARIALADRLDTAEADIDALEAGGFSGLIAALAARVTTLEGGTSVIRSIRRGSASVQANQVLTIPSVTTSKAMVMLLSSIAGDAVGADNNAVIGVSLTSPTQVTLYGSELEDSVTVRYQVVEFV